MIEPVSGACEGEQLTFRTATSLPAGAVFTWNFGELALGAANVANGPAATHRYLSGGTYAVALTLTTADGAPLRERGP